MGHNGRKQESALKLRPEDLSTHLAGRLLPVYLIVGEDPLLTAEAGDAIRIRAREQGFSEREVFQIDRPSTDVFQPAQHAAEAMSLFASRRVIEIRLPGGKPGYGEAGLLRVIEAAGEDLLVLIFAGRIESAAWQSDWLQRIDQRGASLTLWPVDLGRFPDWLRSRFRTAGLMPDADALALLVERTEGNLLAAKQEIEKLALMLPAGARVDVAAVAASSGDSARFDVKQLTRAIGAGDAPRALRLLAGLRAEGTAPVLVLWSLLQARGEPAGTLPHGARRPSPAALTARAVRADRMAKGRLNGEVWDELMLLTTELCGLRVLALSKWQLRIQAQA
jgi:DNA polymerase-3 subunit delta